MGLKEKLKKYVAGLGEDFLEDLKVVSRGKLIIDVNNKQLRTEKSYIALVDKVTGKDILKNRIELDIQLTLPNEIPIGWEVKLDLGKSKK